MVQVGLVYTAASKAAFIGSLYIVVVPIIGIFFKKKTTRNRLVRCGHRCFGSLFPLYYGRFLYILWRLGNFMSTFFFCHPYSFNRNGCNQGGRNRFVRNEAFFPCFGHPHRLCFEDPNLSSVIKVAIPLIFSGILAVGVAYACR